MCFDIFEMQYAKEQLPIFSIHKRAIPTKGGDFPARAYSNPPNG